MTTDSSFGVVERPDQHCGDDLVIIIVLFNLLSTTRRDRQAIDVGFHVHVKFGNSASNRSRVIRLAHFITDQTNDKQYAGHDITTTLGIT